MKAHQAIATSTIWLAVFMGGAGIAYAAQDVVVTTSGDRLVGEIKNVEKDVLTLSTDYSDSDFKIKWDKIVSIESDRQFLLETFDGKRLSGSLTPEQRERIRPDRHHERKVARGRQSGALRTDGCGRASTWASTSATA